MCRRLGGTKEALQEKGIILFSVEKGMKIISWAQNILVHQRIVPAVKGVELVSDSAERSQV
jgi:hypothetical protein